MDDKKLRTTEQAATVLPRLEAVIASRRGGDPDKSWTARLLADAPALPARKLGEEATEVILAAMQHDRDGLTAEAADLLYHLLVVLAAADIPLSAVLEKLQQREAKSGIAEKQSRQTG